MSWGPKSLCPCPRIADSCCIEVCLSKHWRYMEGENTSYPRRLELCTSGLDYLAWWTGNWRHREAYGRHCDFSKRFGQPHWRLSTAWKTLISTKSSCSGRGDQNLWNRKTNLVSLLISRRILELNGNDAQWYRGKRVTNYVLEGATHPSCDTATWSGFMGDVGTDPAPFQDQSDGGRGICFKLEEIYVLRNTFAEKWWWRGGSVWRRLHPFHSVKQLCGPWKLAVQCTICLQLAMQWRRSSILLVAERFAGVPLSAKRSLQESTESKHCGKPVAALSSTLQICRVVLVSLRVINQVVWGLCFPPCVTQMVGFRVVLLSLSKGRHDGDWSIDRFISRSRRGLNLNWKNVIG